jgi:nitroreductase
MKRIAAADLLEAFKWRYATKKFDTTRKIDAESWAALEEALILSPSSFGLQPWKFFVVTDQAVKDSLVPLSWGQTQPAEASHVVIFAVKHPLTAADVRRHIAHTASIQGITVETLAGLEKIIVGFVNNPDLDVRAWSTHQVYIALGNFMTAAALLGIDTCPMEGIDTSAYDKALGIEGSGYLTVAACPAGYRSPDCKGATRPKVRFPAADIVTHIGA